MAGPVRMPPCVQRRETPELREHLKFLEKLECYAGGLRSMCGHK